MAISGGIKLFRKNFGDIDYESSVCEVSTGFALRNNIRDRRTYTKWLSVGSDDLTTETITLVFDGEYTVDRLILIKHNFKAFVVEYWDGSAWVDFAEVVTQEGTQTDVTETACTKETSYYEVTPVVTDRVRISVTSTQVADAEKSLFQFIATEEIGTLEGYPVHDQTHTRTTIKKESPRGRFRFSILDDTYESILTFRNYGKTNDHALMLQIWKDSKDFLIYPCGANASQFRFPMIGNRLEDIYLVFFDGTFDPNYTSNVYQLGLNYQIRLVEVT